MNAGTGNDHATVAATVPVGEKERSPLTTELPGLSRFFLCSSMGTKVLGFLSSLMSA